MYKNLGKSADFLLMKEKEKKCIIPGSEKKDVFFSDTNNSNAVVIFRKKVVDEFKWKFSWKKKKIAAISGIKIPKKKFFCFIGFAAQNSLDYNDLVEKPLVFKRIKHFKCNPERRGA